ncbi:MAG TPA: prepilin-type N-terminal cleavage/methylation domain-containing protein, partial [Gemmatimonadaceae bacterium]
ARRPTHAPLPHMNALRPDRSARDGFTIIEVILVFAIIGIIMSIAIPSVGDTIRRDRLNKAMAIMTSDLEQGFALAARQRAPVRVLLDSTTMAFSLASRADTTFKYRTRQFKTGDLALDVLSSTRKTLDILPTGMAADTLRVKLSIHSRFGALHSRTLRMTRAGLVQIL